MSSSTAAQQPQQSSSGTAFTATPQQPDRDVSESSRHSLRETMVKRRSSLTPAEFQYLDTLCVKGNDVEVQLAASKLLDDDLFFEQHKQTHPSVLEPSMETVELLSFENDDEDSVLSFGSPPSSQRRLELLEERRNTFLFGNMWKAHENGVILSQQGSRRNLMRRNTTALSSSFRRDELMEDVRSDNNRLLSAGGRSKSVTFKEAPAAFLKSRKAAYSRSSSIGSLPSIRQAHLLASSSSMSISSLRRGNALFSEESISSIASPPQIPTPHPFSRAMLRRAHSVHSESRNDEYSERKIDDVLEFQLDNSSPLAATQFLPSVVMRESSQGIEMAQLLDLMPCSSFDESISHQRRVSSTIFRRRQRTYSDESFMRKHDDDVSWRMDDDDEEDDYYDPWKVMEDEYANGGGGTLPFCILGTSADDKDSHPHVLSPPLMESLQAFLPISQSGNHFWMKYSLVRDGASMYTFLQRARGAQHSILAIETVDGEVFGAFTASAWRKNWNFFGTSEAFLWRMRQSRKTKCHSILDQAHLESEIDVYPYTGANSSIQLCLHDKLAVGGGAFDKNTDQENQETIKEYEWGFGLTVAGNFLQGTSNPCLTFGSPSLSMVHSDGSVFEIMNLELWTLTPCTKLADAEKLELRKLFLDGQQHQYECNHLRNDESERWKPQKSVLKPSVSPVVDKCD